MEIPTEAGLSRASPMQLLTGQLAGKHGRTKDALGSVVNADRLRCPGYDSCTGSGWA